MRLLLRMNRNITIYVSLYYKLEGDCSHEYRVREVRKSKECW